VVAVSVPVLPMPPAPPDALLPETVLLASIAVPPSSLTMPPPL
jgi:hypothetical protein